MATCAKYSEVERRNDEVSDGGTEDANVLLDQAAASIIDWQWSTQTE